MAFFKTTFFFEVYQRQTGNLIGGPANIGWTETWYQAADNLEAALTFALTPINYASRRMAFMSEDYLLTWVRVSDVLNPRATKTGYMGVPGAYRFNEQLVAGDRPAQTTCALLVDFTVLPGRAGPQAHHRRFLLRGLQQSQMNGNVIRAGGNKWAQLLTFLDFIGTHPVGAAGQHFASHPWLIRCNLPAILNGQILTLVPNPLNPQNIDVTLNFAPGGNGVQLRVSRARFPRGVNRLWTIVNQVIVGGVTTYTLGRSRFNIAGAFAPPANAVVPVYSYLAPDQYLIIGLRERKVGRPSRLTRGRRSAA